ncbi:hypothetical protein TNCV_4716231 [Trichonephila clavipes]|nr:hypothetical protein TNCV_4716231 [Trichonephila clavipes]
MIPAYNKMRCAAFPFETGIHFRRKTDFFPEEDTTKPYSGLEPEPTRLQAEGHCHHTGWATNILLIVMNTKCLSPINIKADQDATLSEPAPEFTIQYWVAEFKRSRTNCQDEHRSSLQTS